MQITVSVSKQHKEYLDKLTKHAVLQGCVFEGLLGIPLCAGFSCTIELAGQAVGQNRCKHPPYHTCGASASHQGQAGNLLL